MQKQFIFDNATIKSVKADFVKREVVLSISLTLDNAILQQRTDLALIAFEEAPVILTVDVKQLSFGSPLP